MIGWLVSAAWADPAALRLPHREPGAVVGFHDLSVGAPVGPVDAAVELRTDGGAAGASVGLRRALREGAKGWRADTGCAAGLVVPLVAPTVGLTLTPWASAGVVGGRAYVQGLLAAPVAASLGGGLRIPVQPELQAGAILGRLTIGPRVSFGVVWAPGTDVSVTTEGSLAASWR
ncbi:MAG: hypothetical protein H6735_30825 [Alphaproteobacteria bacterium]|nr:hypothetical protein [Alphaproteobacteria bacterium]